MSNVIFVLSFVIFFVASTLMVVGIFTGRVAFGPKKTRLRAIGQWLAIGVASIILTGIFAPANLNKRSANTVATTPQVAEIAKPEAAPAKALPTVRESIQAMKGVVSVEQASIDGGGLEVIYRDMKPLTKSAFVDMIPFGLWSALQKSDPADRESFGSLVVVAEGPLVDSYGKESTAAFFKFVVPGEALAKFNWQSFDYTLLMNHARVVEKSFVGRAVVADYCGSDRSKLFCLTGR